MMRACMRYFNTEQGTVDNLTEGLLSRFCARFPNNVSIELPPSMLDE